MAYYNIKGYVLASQDALNNFKNAISGKPENVALLVTDTFWLIPEAVKYYGEAYSQAIEAYTNNEVFIYQNPLPVSENTKTFVNIADL